MDIGNPRMRKPCPIRPTIHDVAALQPNRRFFTAAGIRGKYHRKSIPAEANMIQVTELGYMGVGVKDLDAWKNFAGKVVGFELADDGERDRCYLRMDYWHHRIVLHQDPSDDLQYLGFRVAGAEEFGAMQRQLSEAGIKFRVGSDDEANERHVLELL